MAVKYVKDFSFDSGFGFTGSKGATPVRAYMRGGAVKKSMNEGSKKAGPRAPALAPAMVEQRSKGLGSLTPETKKLASYDKPHMEGKKGAKVPQYAKGGAVKKHVKKPMAKMMKKAEGGPVAEIMPGDGMSPLQMMQLEVPPLPPDDPRLLPSLPPGYEPPPLGGDLRDLEMIGRPVPMDDDGGRNDFLRQLLERDTQRMRGDAAQQMRDMQQLGIGTAGGRGPEGDNTDYGYAKDNFVGILPTMPPEELPEFLRPELQQTPVRATTPLPEEPVYARPAPYTGPTVAEEDPNRYREMIADMQRATQQPPMLERIITKEMQPGYIRPRADNIPPVPVAPPRPTGMLPSPLAAAARTAPQDRRAMRADRNEMARDIMNRYIGGPRRAMPAARRAMPVAPRKPMIDRSMPQPYMGMEEPIDPNKQYGAPRKNIPAPYMPTYDPSKMVAPPDFVASPEARYAKGGKVSKGEKKIGKVMGEFKRGELHSGSKQGPLVTNPKQAKAIALSEARAAGAKIPKKAMGGKACG